MVSRNGHRSREFQPAVSLIRELDRLQEIETEQDGKQFVLRTPVTGDVGRVFKAVGVALPPNIREADAVAPAGN
jgi:hypothetical protein